MTILTGEHHKVTGLWDLLNRTNLHVYDVLEAVEKDPDLPYDDFAAEANELHEGEPDWQDVDTLHDLPVQEAEEIISAEIVIDNEVVAMGALLRHDHRDWVHLYDGHIHDVVEIRPEEDQ